MKGGIEETCGVANKQLYYDDDPLPKGRKRTNMT
jgi:hypothetical protein